MADKPKADHGGGGGGSSDGFWPIVIVVVLIALALNKTDWGHKLIMGNATSTIATSGLSLTYSDPDWPTTFSYPSDYQVKKTYYRTPAQEAVGEKAEVVGLEISNGNGGVINIGGRQTECGDFAGTQTSCRTVADYPVYTDGKDAGNRAAFDLITSTMHTRK